MVSARWNAALFLVAVVLSTGPLQTAASAGSGLRLETRLTSRTRASGAARYELRPGRAKFSTQVEDVLPGTGLIVTASRGTMVVLLGAVVTNAFGRADLNLDSRVGTFVPDLQAGDVIQVWAGNNPLLEGQLRIK